MKSRALIRILLAIVTSAFVAIPSPAQKKDDPAPPGLNKSPADKLKAPHPIAVDGFDGDSGSINYEGKYR